MPVFKSRLADACVPDAADPFALELYTQEAAANHRTSWVILGYLLLLLGGQTIPQRIHALRVLRSAIHNWIHPDGAQGAEAREVVGDDETAAGGGDPLLQLLESTPGTFQGDEIPLIGAPDGIDDLYPEDEADPSGDH
jgi:hypothetical protein